jgi:predicted lipoprotein with Yx(FWY)xxD motif
MKKKHLIAGAIVAAALALLAGCGSDDDPEQAETTDDSTADAPAAGTTDDSVGEAEGTAEAAFVSTAETDLGEVLVDEAGLTLYGFTQDSDGTPTCLDACADAWPPVLVAGEELPAGLDPEVYSVVERPDDTYRFAGDAAEGDVNGQGTGGVWFAAAPGGTLIQDDAAAAEETTTTAASGGYDY